jgi:hypothetical protein
VVVVPIAATVLGACSGGGHSIGVHASAARSGEVMATTTLPTAQETTTEAPPPSTVPVLTNATSGPPNSTTTATPLVQHIGQTSAAAPTTAPPLPLCPSNEVSASASTDQARYTEGTPVPVALHLTNQSGHACEKPADVNLAVFDAHGSFVNGAGFDAACLGSCGAWPAGGTTAYHVQWDGTASGHATPQGHYTAVMTARAHSSAGDARYMAQTEFDVG